ncbi:MAG: Holliday junction branch migration protein RuvA [Deltaproteobacteria bacterium]|nr:Holliday junction branch migration protein RuvA [Deltaproteobacteria bacterium]
MIAYLTGTPLFFGEDHLILDVNGVGYEVFLPLPNLLQIQQANNTTALSLWIYTVVREDALLLYGFLRREEKEMFLKLVSVSGIGPKLALTILSGIESAQLVRAVLEEDLGRLTAISGIGKKTAERLILELKDKLKHFSASAENSKSIKTSSPKKDELLSALLNLGYNRNEIERFLNDQKRDFSQTFEQLFKEALKFISQKY